MSILSMSLSGLGIFLFGIYLMSEGSRALLGDKLRFYIDRYTSTPAKGLLVGVILTALIQSSSAVIVSLICLVKSKAMSFRQAVPVIIGANIGTTITILLIGLDLSKYVAYLIFPAVIVMMISDNRKVGSFAQMAMGLGVIHLGLMFLSNSLSGESLSAVTDFVSRSPLISFAAGVALTTVIRSSDAAIGFSQVLYQVKAIPFVTAIPFLFGSNIGTCLKAFYYSMDGNISGKRTAMFHLIFNITGAIIGMCALGFIENSAFTSVFAPRMEIAIVHIAFNIVTALVFFPLSEVACGMLEKLMKGEDPAMKDLDSLNPADLPVAAIAMTVGYRSLKELVDMVSLNVAMVRDYIMYHGNDADFASIQRSKKAIRHLDHSLQRYLSNIPGSKLSDEAAAAQTFYLATARNLERICDLNCNVADFVKMANDDGPDTFSPKAYKEIENMYRMFFETLNKAFTFHETWDMKYYKETVELEDRTDAMESAYRNNHIYRARNGQVASVVGSAVYSDILSCLERMNDHCCIIAHNSLARMRRNSKDS